MAKKITPTTARKRMAAQAAEDAADIARISGWNPVPIPLDRALISITLTVAVESYIADEQRTTASDTDMALEAVLQALDSDEIIVLGYKATALTVQARA